MRFVLACLFSFYLACPLPAQVGEVRDSATVMRILKEGKTFMQTEKTRLISAQYFGDAFRLADSIGFYKGQGEALRALGMLDVMDKYKYSPIAMDYFKKSLANIVLWLYKGDSGGIVSISDLLCVSAIIWRRVQQCETGGQWHVEFVYG
ncbi:MAG: hypothetical protein EAZ14_11910 [Runella slithyformis]|nr:MAG: hypothetical protein EAZ14_11910 [Runella slithyformis]